jgi:zinc transport system permease protein
VGVLLITAMLILPAAAARPMARSPESMVMIAFGVGAISVLAGLTASWRWDTPAGPSIILAAALTFLVSNSLAAVRA